MGQLGGLSRSHAGRIYRERSRRSRQALKQEYASFTPRVRRDRDRHSGREDHRSGGRHRDCRHGVLDAQLACRGGRASLGLADHALPVPARRPHRRDRRTGRREPALRRTSSSRSIRIRRRRPSTGTSCCSRSEFPLAFFEMSFLLPHFLKEGRGRLDTYFTRVYNPLWTNPDGFSVDGGAPGRIEDRDAHRAHADLERDGVVRRLRAADGTRHRTARHDEPGDARRALARVPPAGQARRARKEGHSRSAHTYEANPGEVWEESEFWIALSWKIDPDGVARHPEVLRIALPARREDHRRRVLRLDVRELGARPARGCREGRPDAAPVHAPVRRLQSGRRGLQQGARAAGRDRAASWSTASRRAGFNTPSRKLEFYSPTLAEWGWPEHAIPRYVPGHVYWRDLDRERERVRSAAELPAADADSHAIAGEVALRDLAQQPAVDCDRAMPRSSASQPAIWSRCAPASASSSRARGSPKASGPAWSACRTTWAAGGCTRTRAARAPPRRSCKIARDDDGTLRDAAGPRRAAVRERRSRQRARSGGAKSASTRT